MTPRTWADYHAKRMAVVERSSVVSISHVLLLAAALASVVFS